MQADHLVGLITLSDIRHIPREQWGQVPVSNAMIPLERLHVVTPQQSLSDVLPLMAGRVVDQLPLGHKQRPFRVGWPGGPYQLLRSVRATRVVASDRHVP